jgi:hypothetical protein
MNGKCQCPTVGQRACGGSCIDVQADAMNCGGCGHQCDSGDTCANGFCPLDTIAGTSAAPEEMTQQGLAYDVELSATKVYWITAVNTNVMSANLDGTGVATEAGTGVNPRRLAIDATNLYWSECGTSCTTAGGAAGAVNAVPLGGGSVDNIVTGELDGVFGLAVDTNFAYFTNVLISKVRKENVVTPSTPTDVASNVGEPWDVLVDSNMMYWTNQGDGTVRRANVDGSGSLILANGQGGPFGIAKDATHVYFSTEVTGDIRRVPVAGGTVETFVSGQSQPVYLALDGEDLFWCNFGNGVVSKIDKDGTGEVTQLAVGQNQPYSLRVNATHLYFTTLAGGTVMRVAR